MTKDYGLWRYNTSFEEFKKNFKAILEKHGLDGEIAKELNPPKQIGVKALITTSDGREVEVPAYEDDYDTLRGDEVPFDAQKIKLYNIVEFIDGVNDKYDLKTLEFTSYLRHIRNSFNNCESLQMQNTVWGNNGQKGVELIADSFNGFVGHTNTGTTSVTFPDSLHCFDNVLAMGYEKLTSVTLGRVDKYGDEWNRYYNVTPCSFENNCYETTGVTTVRAYGRIYPVDDIKWRKNGDTYQYSGNDEIIRCGLTSVGTLYVPKSEQEFFENHYPWCQGFDNSKLRYF